MTKKKIYYIYLYPRKHNDAYFIIFCSSQQNLAAPSPAANPVLQQRMKLNPHVTPST